MTGADALVDLLYAERRPGRWAHRPSVQAIGRLDDAALEALAGELRTRGLLEPSDSDDLELPTRARRWRASAGRRGPPPPTGGSRRPPSPTASCR